MYNLERFKEAQEQDYVTALKEIKNGRKESHWIWYVFPQLKELGYSSTSKYYGISNLEEAKEYMKDPLLSKRLLEITEALLGIEGKTAHQILGDPDDMKVHSSMTLFYLASEHPVFKQVIDKYYEGKMDKNTLNLLKTER